MATNSELSDFLRSCRARLRPGDVGLLPEGLLRDHRVRRVAGLRREEVARAAGVSVDYYTRLEQGRTRQVGRSVLQAVADTLRMNQTEREYFYGLISNQADPLNTPRARAAGRVRPSLQRIVDGTGDAACFVLGNGMQVLAMNRLARELLFDIDSVPSKDRNLARWTFLDPAARERYQDWETVASDAAAILRRDAARTPGDRDLLELIGDLTVRSDDFRRMWAQHQVFACTFGSKRLRHPLAGSIDIDYEAFEVPDATGQKLFIYTVAPGSPSSEAMRLLSSWIAPSRDIGAGPAVGSAQGGQAADSPH